MSYRRRLEMRETPGVGLGAVQEGRLLVQLLFNAGARRGKPYPVVFDDAAIVDVVSLDFQAFQVFHLPREFDALLRALAETRERAPAGSHPRCAFPRPRHRSKCLQRGRSWEPVRDEAGLNDATDGSDGGEPIASWQATRTVVGCAPRMRGQSWCRLVVVLALAGCGARTDPDFDPNGELEGWSDLGEPNPSAAGSARCVAVPGGTLALAHSGDLYGFAPESGVAIEIGTVNCGLGPHLTMAIDSTGVMWIVDTLGRLYAVHLESPVCTRVDFDERELYGTYGGSGLVMDRAGREHYYVVPTRSVGARPNFTSEIVDIDLERLQVRARLPVSRLWSRTELAGTRDGRLFAMVENSSSGFRDVLELDPTDGSVLEVLFTVDGPILDDFDLMYWGGSLYLFGSDGDRTTVLRHRLGEGERVEHLATLPALVAADAPACVPR